MSKDDYAHSPYKPKLGVIRGVPFVDTPREQLETVIISRASWEEVKKSARDAKTSAYSACVVAGLSLLFAVVTAMNHWH